MVAEPIGVVAGVTPVTNPTSTTMFKALISIKGRNPIIFSFHPSAQKCSSRSCKNIKRCSYRSWSTRKLYSMDRKAITSKHLVSL